MALINLLRARPAQVAPMPPPDEPCAPATPPAAALTDLCEAIEAELDSTVAAGRRQAARTAQSSATMTRQAAAVMAEIQAVAASAARVNQNVTATAAGSEQLSAAGREIAEQAARSSAIARSAAAKSGEAVTAMTTLSEAASTIGEVVRAISAIAAQTNLLALNATIEAARAGEAGRGFSVVAAEVKALARQTATATRDIGARIAEVQAAARQSAAAMTMVAEIVNGMDGGNAAVAAAVEQQEATIREIAVRLHEAAGETDDVARTIAQTAVRVEEMHTLSGIAETEARRTAASTEDLRNSVFVVLRREAARRGSTDANVPVDIAATMATNGWQGGVTVLEISRSMVLLRPPADIGATLVDSEPGASATLSLPGVGLLDATILAGSTSRVALQFVQPPPGGDRASRALAELIARIEDQDKRFIEASAAAAAEIQRAVQDAIAAGACANSAPFDKAYVEVAGSDPAQYTTAFTATADRVVRPILDHAAKFDPRVIGVFMVDRNGYAPTHNTHYSEPQRKGDPAWNAGHCRNRWIFDDRAGLTAGRTTRDHLLQCYERDMGNGVRVTIKEAVTPINVGGRHWGGLRVMYRNE